MEEAKSEGRAVPLAARVVDAIGGLLFLGGVVVYVRAWLGMREIIGIELEPELQPATAIERMDRLSEVARLGMWLMAAGLVVFVAGTAWAWWRRRRP